MALTDIDRRILNQCLSRAPGAWEDFVDRFIGVIVHVVRHTAHARSVPLTPDDTDDLCAEVFVALLNNDFAVLRNFRGESSLSTYLTVVARRVAVKEISRRRKAEAMGHVAAHQSSLGTDNGRSHVDSIEEAEEIRQLLKQLPPQEARIVELFYLEGRSYQAISAELGIPQNSIGPTLTRAREQMAQSRVPFTATP